MTDSTSRWRRAKLGRYEHPCGAVIQKEFRRGRTNRIGPRWVLRVRDRAGNDREAVFGTLKAAKMAMYPLRDHIGQHDDTCEHCKQYRTDAWWKAYRQKVRDAYDNRRKR